VIAQFGQPRAPDWTFPIVFQVIEPGRDFDHRRALASVGIGDARTIERFAEVNLGHCEHHSDLARMFMAQTSRKRSEARLGAKLYADFDS
jgi:hypothetical protein